MSLCTNLTSVDCKLLNFSSCTNRYLVFQTVTCTHVHHILTQRGCWHRVWNSDTSDDIRSTDADRNRLNAIAKNFSMATNQIRVDTCKSSEQTCPVANRNAQMHGLSDPVTAGEDQGLSLAQCDSDAQRSANKWFCEASFRRKSCYLYPV
jgi:hypothetical protein